MHLDRGENIKIKPEEKIRINKLIKDELMRMQKAM